MTPLTLDPIPGRCAVCRLPPDAPLPHWSRRPSPLLSITRTTRELSIITDQQHVPAGVRAERDFAAMSIRGPLDFGAVGILSDLTSILAKAAVPVLAISSHDTDVLLVRADHWEKATTALRAAGHTVN